MNILIIEDHEGIRMALEILLELEGFRVKSVDRGEAALDCLNEAAFDLVLLDYSTNGISADVFMSEFRTRYPKSSEHRPKVCLLSASASISVEAKHLDVDHLVRKPFEHNEFVDFLKQIEAEKSGRTVQDRAM